MPLLRSKLSRAQSWHICTRDARIVYHNARQQVNDSSTYLRSLPQRSRTYDMSTVSVEHSTDSDFIGDRPQERLYRHGPRITVLLDLTDTLCESDSLSSTTSIYGTHQLGLLILYRASFLSFALHLRPAAVSCGLPNGHTHGARRHGDYD